MKIFKNIWDCWKHIPYTLKHWYAYQKLSKKLCGFIYEPFHDLDKVIMYIFIPSIGVQRIKEIHKKYIPHHITEDKDSTECDYLAAILDYECARFTKPDKPANAIETILRKPNSKHFYNLLSRVYLLDLIDDVDMLKYKELYDNRRI